MTFSERSAKLKIKDDHLSRYESKFVTIETIKGILRIRRRIIGHDDVPDDIYELSDAEQVRPWAPSSNTTSGFDLKWKSGRVWHFLCPSSQTCVEWRETLRSYIAATIACGVMSSLRCDEEEDDGPWNRSGTYTSLVKSTERLGMLLAIAEAPPICSPCSTPTRVGKYLTDSATAKALGGDEEKVTEAVWTPSCFVRRTRAATTTEEREPRKAEQGRRSSELVIQSISCPATPLSAFQRHKSIRLENKKSPSNLSAGNEPIDTIIQEAQHLRRMHCSAVSFGREGRGGRGRITRECCKLGNKERKVNGKSASYHAPKMASCAQANQKRQDSPRREAVQDASPATRIHGWETDLSEEVKTLQSLHKERIRQLEKMMAKESLKVAEARRVVIAFQQHRAADNNEKQRLKGLIEDLEERLGAQGNALALSRSREEELRSSIQGLEEDVKQKNQQVRIEKYSVMEMATRLSNALTEKEEAERLIEEAESISDEWRKAAEIVEEEKHLLSLQLERLRKQKNNDSFCGGQKQQRNKKTLDQEKKRPINTRTSRGQSTRRALRI